MSDAEYGKEEQGVDLEALAQYVSEVGDILLLEQQIKADVDQKVKKVIAKGVKRTRRVTTERDRLIAEMIPLYYRLLGAKVFKGKTISLPSGAVSTRDATSTEVHNASGLLELAKRLRKLTKMSERPPRKVSKTMLARLMEAEPKVAEQFEAAGLAERVIKNRFTVKPNSSKLKFEQDHVPTDRVVVLASSSKS